MWRFGDHFAVQVSIHEVIPLFRDYLEQVPNAYQGQTVAAGTFEVESHIDRPKRAGRIKQTVSFSLLPGDRTLVSVTADVTGFMGLRIFRPFIAPKWRIRDRRIMQQALSPATKHAPGVLASLSQCPYRGRDGRQCVRHIGHRPKHALSGE